MQRVACLEQVTRHRRAHVAQTNESDIHGSAPTSS
jgi:hypothetical protein